MLVLFPPIFVADTKLIYGYNFVALLISLFHVQIQEPKCRSTTTRAFIFLAKFAEFYYHKIFETRSR